jgi:transcriptional regulator with XRE-family HTH domain
MQPYHNPVVLGLALTLLRISLGWKQQDLAAAVGLKPNTLCGYEKGKPALTRERLDKYASRMGAAPLRVELAILAAGLVLLVLPDPASPVDPSKDQILRLEEAVAVFLPKLVGQLRDLLFALVRAARAELDKDQAEALWKQLEPHGKETRLARVRGDAAYHTWAMALRLCDESERKAADCATGAREVAELALEVVRWLRSKNPDDRFYIRLQGLSEAILANAFRVKGDHDQAEAGFAKAWQLWKEGTDEAHLLSEARLVHLQASLRRDQRRFVDALRMHDDSFELARPGEESSISRFSTRRNRGSPARASPACGASCVTTKRSASAAWGERPKRSQSWMRCGSWPSGCATASIL